MGRPKAELTVGGVRLVDRAVAVLTVAGCAEVLVVARAGVRVSGARILVNDAPERGMRSSLDLAVNAAQGDALAVLLVDTPGVSSDAVRAVIQAWVPGRIAVASYSGRRAHPIVMAPRLWRDALASAADDEGARALLAARADLVDEIAVAGDPTDIDTEQDLARWAEPPP
jgi:CTP:molybdopterin cytidylyltransferase MocA